MTRKRASISRRSALAMSASALLVGTSARAQTSAPRSTAQRGQVVFGGYGGTLQKAQREFYFDSFEKETGIRVVDATDISLARVRAMVEAGNVQWDVVQSQGQWVPQGERLNLWEPLDYNIIPRNAVPPALSGNHSIALLTSGIIQAYNTRHFGDRPPANWADFWNIAGLPGRRGLLDAPRYVLEAALMADGVAPASIYPLDLDRAFRSLDRIKKQVHVWWSQWPQPPQLLSTGELAT